MKRHHSFGIGVAALAAAAALALAPAAFAAEPHAHEQSAAHAALSLDHGKKWHTDEALRRGMSDMREALAGQLPAIRAGKQNPERYRQLGATLSSEVAYVVANCRLEPAADAMLHVVIAEIVAAADTLQAADDAAQARTGALRAARALNDYGRYFNHPGWKALAV